MSNVGTILIGEHKKEQELHAVCVGHRALSIWTDYDKAKEVHQEYQNEYPKLRLQFWINTYFSNTLAHEDWKEILIKWAEEDEQRRNN
jgi:hypothetical protein